MRFDDWPERLADYLDRNRKAGFAWGVNDCCTFAAGAVEAITGVDPMAEFRGAYTDEESSKAALRSIGKRSLYHTLTAKFGRPVAAGQAQRGDVLMCEMKGRPSLLVCAGGVGFGPGGDGLVEIPVAQCRRAWKVR